MAKSTKKAPKKRTKKAVAARKYNKKLQQRAKAGEQKAKDIIRHRAEYKKEYEERRRQRREEALTAARQESGGAEVREPIEGDADARTSSIDSGMGGSDYERPGEAEEQKQEAGEEGQQHNPLFVKPAPDPPLGPAPLSSTSQHARLGRWGREHHQHPVSQYLLGKQQRDHQRMLRSRGITSQQRPAVGGRGKLLRRSLGGALAKMPNAGAPESVIIREAEAEDEESLESLEDKRENIRRRREALLRQEVEIEIQLRQRAEQDRALS